MSEHEPGTVAVATVRGVPNVRVVRSDESDMADAWFTAVQFDGCYDHMERYVTDVRPLVVIDPEDAEQLAQLAELLIAKRAVLSDHAVWHKGVGDALREFANPTPPKPPEPQGLGAVVEDKSQVEFIHLGSGLWAYGTMDGPSQGFSYSDIDAVRVLSEGVPA